MRKIFFALVAVLCFTTSLRADEGMWLLPYLQKFNAAQMKEKGLEIDVESVYSEKNSSLKDAIVLFGGFCTGEIISSQSLILTNHHCGFGAIQQHSSVEHDYLKDGFWAMDFKEEIPTPGLFVTFIKSMVDVTDKIVPHLSDKLSEDERKTKVLELSAKIEKNTKLEGVGMHAEVREFLGGNQYILMITQTYNDIRLVGAPPSSIGKFGGDTDNWMWPRHTGDFSLFRIYADQNGNPAEFSQKNVPLKTKNHLTISLKGVKKGDFTMIMGFPGSTSRYASSFEIDERETLNNKNAIKIRGAYRDVMLGEMKSDPKVQIQYASKHASLANGWKNSIGMNAGIEKFDIKGSKRALESEFAKWVDSGDKERKEQYGDALKLKEEGVESRRNYRNVSLYISNAFNRGVELLNLPNMLSAYNQELKLKESGKENKLSEVTKTTRKSVDEFFSDYNVVLDKKAAKVMVKMFMKDIDTTYYPEILKKLNGLSDQQIDSVVDNVYQKSIFSDYNRIQKFLNEGTSSLYDNDVVTLASKSINKKAKEMFDASSEFSTMVVRGHRKFIGGMLKMNEGKSFYPDANMSIRLTYGNVLPYKPADAVEYDYFTTLKGVLEKEDPNNQYEFSVPKKLKDLYKNKDFGDYAENGDVPVGFISNNDITGGNSGSPVMNGKGELVGTAFDGNWEGLTGDIMFDYQRQRCISVDIRYTLFIIDKFAGCRRLIDEMTIVK